MKGEMIIISQNGGVIRRDITSEEYDTQNGKLLKALQDAVGGYVEMVPRFYKFGDKNCVAFCNEEGKIMDNPKLRINCLATELWLEQNKLGGDVLVGNVVILSGDDEFLGIV